MRKKSSANLSVDILQYLAHFLYAFLRFDSRSPKQNRLPYRCSVSYSIDASGNLLRKHDAGMFSLRASPVRFPRSENKKTAEWRSFCFGGDEGNRTPVRKHVLKDFSGRSHFIEIPAAVRQMTGLQGW